MAVKFVMQEWVDKYYEETGEAGCWNGNLYTGQYLRWCLQHLTDELEKTAPQKINVAQNSASDNTTKSEISKLIRELEVSHTIGLSVDDMIAKLQKLSDIC